MEEIGISAPQAYEAFELLKVLIGIHRTTAETDVDMLENTIRAAELLTGYEYVEEPDVEWCAECQAIYEPEEAA